MAKSKWETHVKDKLILVEGWARDGLTDEQIAKNLRIGIRTLYEYKERYPQFLQSLKKGKEVVDIEVENALLKKALGYKENIKKAFKVKNVEYDDSGKKVREYEEIVLVNEEVFVPADTTAQIFWLKNRRPDKWKDKNIVEHEGELKTSIQNISDEELNFKISNLQKALGVKNEE